jgi:hypothetical protein
MQRTTKTNSTRLIPSEDGTVTTQDDGRQEFLTVQLMDELIFKGGRDVMALDQGPEAHSGRRSPLGKDPLLSPNKIRFRV